MKGSTRELCLKGLMIALVTLSTMIFQIPVSATHGYIHLGDSMILLISIFFGWRYGMVAGGVGSALADILSGYAHWALFTLLIKGFMGYLAGKISGDTKRKSVMTVRNSLASTMGVLWMVLGYFIAGGILKSSFAVALTSVPENIIQGAAGYFIFAVIGAALNRIKMDQYLSEK